VKIAQYGRTDIKDNKVVVQNQREFRRPAKEPGSFNFGVPYLTARYLMCIRAAIREMRATTNAIIHRFMVILIIALYDILEIDSGYHRT